MFTIRNQNNFYLTKDEDRLLWTNTCSKREHWRLEHIDEHGGLIMDSKVSLFLSEAVFGNKLPPLIRQIKSIMVTRDFNSDFHKK